MSTLVASPALPQDEERAPPSRFARQWAPWLLVLNLAGYPIVGMVATLLNLDSSILSIPFRVVVLLLSLYVIIGAAHKARWMRRNLWLLALLGFYLLRLLYDGLVAGLQGALEALTFFVMACLVPAVASGMAGMMALGEKRSAWRLAAAGGVACGLAVLMHVSGLGGARTLDAFDYGGRLQFEAVNSITIGHTAASTLIALVCLTRTRMPAANHLLLMIIGAVALWALLLAGSRGPMVALAFAGIAYAIATRKFGWIALLVVTLGASLLYGDSVLVERFSTTAADASSLERFVIQGNAIVQFLASPVFGSAYAELITMEYPHNLFIETAMALGLIGLALLLIVLWRTLRLAVRSLGEGYTLLAMLTVQMFLAVQLSGALWEINGFWLVLAVVGSYPMRKKARRRRRTRPA